MSTNRTRVYIDGFNFYYGAFRDGPHKSYKWLNPVRFCREILPADSKIDMVQGFTRAVK
jgi:hypothetical protein